jgi:hypothetical protein
MALRSSNTIRYRSLGFSPWDNKHFISQTRRLGHWVHGDYSLTSNNIHNKKQNNGQLGSQCKLVANLLIVFGPPKTRNSSFVKIKIA